MLPTIDNNTIREIISVSNHTNEESVLKAFSEGILEVYPNESHI